VTDKSRAPADESRAPTDEFRAPTGESRAPADQSRAPVTVPLQLRWADTDVYGHVNNVTYARYLEEARIRAFGLPDHPMTAPPDRPPIFARLEPGTFTMTVAQRLEHVHELAYHGQSILADMWLSRIGSSSLDIGYRLYHQDGAPTYLRAQVTLVVCDLGSRRPRPLSAAEAQALAPYRGEPVSFR
jgi:acyl-CoA thioester hydrolase